MKQNKDFKFTDCLDVAGKYDQVQKVQCSFRTLGKQIIPIHPHVPRDRPWTKPILHILLKIIAICGLKWLHNMH